METIKDVIIILKETLKIKLIAITTLLKVIGIDITEKQVAIIITTLVLLGLIVIIRKKCKR